LRNSEAKQSVANPERGSVGSVNKRRRLRGAKEDRAFGKAGFVIENRMSGDPEGTKTPEGSEIQKTGRDCQVRSFRQRA